MNTTEIAIGALSLISTGFGILLTLKYITLKTYYKGKCERHDEANETIAELQVRIGSMAKQRNYYNDKVDKLLSEISEKNAKILQKNKEIQHLKNKKK